ncbi:hypothetical protein O181_094043 [Austropuccinia psidii MF-1]|uniref:Uncharacterized protein n=1 Tax=Austropuccinia psidii MF-1 TaxID=1389203 RepID=A0A9Q3P9X3_9BASI|nr:hypothetical protein [Austropuccinia psidii MF-1]
MTIAHQDVNIHKSADVPEESSPQILIEGISVTDLNITFFEELRKSYTQNKNCSILCQLLTKDFENNSLIHALDEMWRKSYYEGRFHLLDGIVYHRKLAYKTSINSSTNQTPAILEKGWHPKLPQDSLRKDLVEINPTNASFKGILEKTKKHAIRCMEDSFSYAKDKWDKSHATPDFKVGDLVLVSTTNLNNIKVCKKLKDSFAGPFVIKALHGETSVELE